MLLQEHATELGEAGRWIVEGAEDSFSVLDVERENHRLYLQSPLEHGRGRLVDEIGQLADEVGLTGMPASIIGARLREHTTARG
jgi:hypothetical protein